MLPASRVLEEIGIREKDTLLVFNKTDAIKHRARLDGLRGRYPSAVPISAESGAGLPQLAMAVSDALSRGFADVDVKISVGDGRLMAYLSAHGEVFSKQYHDDHVLVHCRLPQKHLGAIRKDGVVICRHHNGSVSNGAKDETPVPERVEEVA